MRSPTILLVEGARKRCLPEALDAVPRRCKPERQEIISNTVIRPFRAANAHLSSPTVTSTLVSLST